MWLTALRTLERIGELGAAAGVTFCVENLNTIVDHPGVPLARAKDTLALVEGVGHPNVKMMLDLYHAQIGEGNLIELVRRCGDAIGEIQVADVPGRCEPGTGEINYPAIAKALRDMGYTGTVGHGSLGVRRQRRRAGSLPRRVHLIRRADAKLPISWRNRAVLRLLALKGLDGSGRPLDALGFEAVFEFLERGALGLRHELAHEQPRPDVDRDEKAGMFLWSQAPSSARGRANEIIALVHHSTNTAMPIAKPRMLSGKISESSSHTQVPMNICTNATNTTMQPRIT